MGLISRVSSRTYRILEITAMVLSITNKLQKKNNQRASDIESGVAQAILDIQNGADNATKEQLMQLHLVAVKEVDVGGRNALILMVPAPQVVGWQKNPDQNRPRIGEEILWQTRHDHRSTKSDGQRSQKSRCQMLQTKTTNQPKCPTRS